MKQTLIFNSKNRYLTLIALLGFYWMTLSGQQLRATYPIQVSAYLKPPYSLHLGEYTNGTREKLMVQLLNRDLQQPELQVQLHLSISAGNGVRIETRDYQHYPVIRLLAGVPYQLTQSDLSPYFQSGNWNVQGVLDNGRLPEGMIEICIHAIEVNTGRLLSQTGCARAWVTLNRPPLLNLPATKTVVPFRDPVNLLFQWTPRHQALSNVEYEFVLKEIWDEAVSPDVAFAYSQEIYRTTTRLTSFAYTAMYPPLLENKRYAWQVRAMVRDGFEEINLFENQGYSEIYSFSIGQSCHAPTGISHHQETERLIIEWTPVNQPSTYTVAYRGKSGDGDWHLIQTTTHKVNVFDLATDTEYEYKVGTVCTDGSLVYSPVYTVVLEDWKKDLKATCGTLPDAKIKVTNPLQELRVGDVFFSGDFSVTVMSVTGGNGVFSGTGWIRFPLVAYSKLAVQFEKITINDEYRMVKGAVEASYDKSGIQLANGNALFYGGSNTGQTQTGAVTSQVKADFIIPEQPIVIYDKETGSIEIRDEDGNRVGTLSVPDETMEVLNNGKATVITVQDKEGVMHTVTQDEKGNLSIQKTGTQESPLPAGSFSETELASKKAVVEFYSLPGHTYAFDQWKEHYRSVSLITDENKYEFIGNYAVPCQLIPSGKTEKVGVKINILDKKNIKEDSILFKTKTGYTVRPENGVLTLNGGKTNDAQDLYALYPDGKGGYWTLGKLKILSYSEPEINLVLVPVRCNGQVYTTDIHAVREKLDQVYQSLGITWNVSLDEPFDYPAADMESEGGDLFSRYTDEMKELNNTYIKSGRSFDKKAVYIFILRSGNIKGKNISGDMPRGKQFGYVFTDAGNLPWTIAHEVAHGKFKLRHTFDNDYGNGLEKETDNLMNYYNGTYLAKWQWDEIFDPALLVSPFESDEDGMAPVVDNEKLYACIEEIRRSLFTGSEVKLRNYSLLSKGEMFLLGGMDYSFITVKRMNTQQLTFSLKDCLPELFTEKNFYGEIQYCIGYLNKTVTFVLKNQKDRENLHDYLTEKRTNSFLLFVSGYSPSDEILDFLNKNENKEQAESWFDRVIGYVSKTPVEYDSKEYWGHDFVDAMVARLKPKRITYMAGYDDVGTSNHRSIGNFLKSLMSSYNTRYNLSIPAIPCYQNKNCVSLSESPNGPGFTQRQNNGKKRGLDYVEILKSECARNTNGMVVDTLDVVCHSMGFAHALGIIDAVKSSMKNELKGLTLGRFYIIAPENACSGKVDEGEWKDIWQYGSNEVELKDKPWLLDGVAPQCKVGGVSDLKRVFIPTDGSVSQGFLESHKIESYMWIFKIERDGDNSGYIYPRK